MELRSRRKTLGDEGRGEDGNGSDCESSGSSDDEVYEGSGSSESEDSDEGDIPMSRKRKERPKKDARVEEEVEVAVEEACELEDIEENDTFEEVCEPDDVGSSDLKSGTKRSKKGKSKPILMWNIWEEEHNKWLDENVEKDFDLDKDSAMIIESAEEPSDVTVDLIRYQKEWLAWALKQEFSEIRGGILADEMGMGKTIQAIALVLAKRQLSWKIGGPPLSCGLMDGERASSSEPKIMATLVMCPVVAVSQWVSEIERFTSKGSTKVLVYHGAKREKLSKEFANYDFVITTYSIVESEFRKYMMPPKDKCPFCGKLLYENKMSIHWKYYCGPNAQKTFLQSRQSKKKSKPVTSPSYQDPIKRMDTQRLYWDSKKNRKWVPKGQSPLYSVMWERIILDEAHFIKARHCNTAKATQALKSTFKWALSGTPIQNRVGELYSLIRFLQVVPYSFYLCKDCDCRALDHSPTTQCSHCPHKSVRHFCWWNKFIATPIQLHPSTDTGKRAMILLKHKILKSLLLRRTKMGRASDLALPPRIVSLRKDVLDEREQDYYESLYNDSQAEFNTYVEAGTILNNYAHIFDLLTRLRQAVDHPYLVVYSASTASRNEIKANTVEQICGICDYRAVDHMVTSCKHVFCKACLLDYSSSLGQVYCPSCSKLLTIDFTTIPVATNRVSKTATIKGFRSSSIINRIKLDKFQTCTKIEALKEEIRFMVEKDGSAKGIVFSQFTSFLDLINYSLKESGVKCVQLVGSMTLNARDAAIKKFIEDPDCKIFLMSLKAGGVALNLTVASHVFLMDPWWNPAVERQAQDRIHRIGQYKPIRIVRFIIENTVEERILKLQEKKELMFEGTVGGSSEALGKLTEADMKFLFVT